MVGGREKNAATGPLRCSPWTSSEPEIPLSPPGSSAPTTAASDQLPYDDARPNESAVMQLASLWSIDPTILDEQFKEPLTGILGTWAKS